MRSARMWRRRFVRRSRDMRKKFCKKNPLKGQKMPKTAGTSGREREDSRMRENSG